MKTTFSLADDAIEDMPFELKMVAKVKEWRAIGKALQGHGGGYELRRAIERALDHISETASGHVYPPGPE